MDGPYTVHVERVGPQACVLRALERREHDTVVIEEEVALLPFAQTFILRAQELLSACTEQRWWSDDVDVLQTSCMRWTENSCA